MFLPSLNKHIRVYTCKACIVSTMISGCVKRGLLIDNNYLDPRYPYVYLSLLRRHCFADGRCLFK